MTQRQYFGIKPIILFFEIPYGFVEVRKNVHFYFFLPDALLGLIGHFYNGPSFFKACITSLQEINQSLIIDPSAYENTIDNFF